MEARGDSREVRWREGVATPPWPLRIRPNCCAAAKKSAACIRFEAYGSRARIAIELYIDFPCGRGRARWFRTSEATLRAAQ
jgi:hypothetical protein